MCFTSGVSIAIASVRATLDRDTISINETVKLIIVSDDVNTTASPDLQVLKQNFDLLGTATTQNISITNGKRISEKKWITEIEPKTQGVFTIPPISVGAESTSPLHLKVLPENKNISPSDRDVFLKTELSADTIYVQEQAVLTIRLYLGVRLLSGSLSDPEPLNTDVRRRGQDAQYTVTFDGRPYTVIERKYTLFPENSGLLTISPVRFQGLVAAKDQGNLILNSIYNQGVRINIKSDEISLQILPPDPVFDGKVWLPAKNLEITQVEEFSKTVKAGQAVTRQIQIKATGLAAEQLPDLEFEDSPAFRQYPDRPIRKTALVDNDIIGTVNHSIAFIASSPGELILPSVQLKWWDIRSKTTRVAELPQTVVQVIPDQLDIVNHQSTDTPITSSPHQRGDIEDSPLVGGIWIWISLGVFFCWIISSFILWLKIRKLQTPKVSSIQIPLDGRDKLLSAISEACKMNEPHRTRELTIQLAYTIWGQEFSGGLAEIAQRIGVGPLADKMYQLDRCLYSEKPSPSEPWEGQPFAENLSAWAGTIKSTVKTDKPTLPELYPTTA